MQRLGLDFEGFDEDTIAQYFDENIERIRKLDFLNEQNSSIYKETHDRQMYILWNALSGTAFYAVLVHCIRIRNFSLMLYVLIIIPIVKLFIIFQFQDNIFLTFLKLATQNFQSVVTHQGVYIFLRDSCGFPASTVNLVLYLIFASVICLALKEYKKDQIIALLRIEKYSAGRRRSTNNIRVSRQNRRIVPTETRFSYFKIDFVKITEPLMAKIGYFFGKTDLSTVTTPTPAPTPTPAAFFDACWNGDKDVVRCLLSTTTPDLIDILMTLEEQSGLSAYHLACAGGHLSIVQQLMAKSGKEICFELVSKDGRTGLELATEAGRKNVVKVILGNLKGKQMR